MDNTEHGRSPFRGSGCQPTASAAISVASSQSDIPNAQPEPTAMPRGEPIYVAIVLAKRWIDQGKMETNWSLAWASYRETALGAAVASCRAKNPDFDIGTTGVIKIPRESRTKSELFWAGFFAGLFAFALLTAAIAMETHRAETPKSGSVAKP